MSIWGTRERFQQKPVQSNEPMSFCGEQLKRSTPSHSLTLQNQSNLSARTGERVGPNVAPLVF